MGESWRAEEARDALREREYCSEIADSMDSVHEGREEELEKRERAGLIAEARV
jgi:hypothetical protein